MWGSFPTYSIISEVGSWVHMDGSYFGCFYHPISISWIPVFWYTPYPTNKIPSQEVVSHLLPHKSYPKQNSFRQIVVARWVYGWWLMLTPCFESEAVADFTIHHFVTSPKTWATILKNKLLRCSQWLFLVPLKGGRDYIIPQLAVYTTYIPLIYCLLGGYIIPTTF